jgi:hypothetical protein
MTFQEIKKDEREAVLLLVICLHRDSETELEEQKKNHKIDLYIDVATSQQQQGTAMSSQSSNGISFFHTVQQVVT